MELISFSDYPAPADERSQMQVRQERKGELAVRAQETAESRLDPQSKSRALDGIREQQDANSRKITSLRFQKEAREKAQAESRAAQEQNRRSRLDTKA